MVLRFLFFNLLSFIKPLHSKAQHVLTPRSTQVRSRLQRAARTFVGLRSHSHPHTSTLPSLTEPFSFYYLGPLPRASPTGPTTHPLRLQQPLPFRAGRPQSRTQCPSPRRPTPRHTPARRQNTHANMSNNPLPRRKDLPNATSNVGSAPPIVFSATTLSLRLSAWVVRQRSSWPIIILQARRCVQYDTPTIIAGTYFLSSRP